MGAGAGGAWIWPLRNLERDLFFHPFNFFSSTAALVSLDSLRPGQDLCLWAAKFSGPQHCYSLEEPLLQSSEDGVGV